MLDGDQFNPVTRDLDLLISSTTELKQSGRHPACVITRLVLPAGPVIARLEATARFRLAALVEIAEGETVTFHHQLSESTSRHQTPRFIHDSGTSASNRPADRKRLT